MYTCSLLLLQHPESMDRILRTTVELPFGNEKNQTIRYVYIHKNTTFTLTKIPEGKYYLKIAYGEKWGVVAGESNCKGRFTENSLCKKGTEILDYNIIHYSDGRYQVPSFSLSLNVVFIKDDNSNKFDTDKIPENDFYNE